MAHMRREAVATDPLAHFSSPPPPFHAPFPPPPPPPPPPPLHADRIDHGPPPVSRTVPAPVLSLDESADAMMNAFVSKCRKPPLDPSTVPADLNGLTIFAKSSAWRHVVELSSRVIESSISAGSSFPVATKLRLEGLFRLKMFDDLSYEAGNILAAERIKLLKQLTEEELIQNKNKVYAMQLLLAEVKAMTGNGEDAFQELYQLRKELEESIPSVPTSSSFSQSEWWSWRVTSSIINTAIRQRLWRIALSELTGLIKSLRERHRFNLSLGEPSSPGECSAATKESILSFQRVEIVVLCRLSRILLQIGAMKASQSYYQQAHEVLLLIAKDMDVTSFHSSDFFDQVELTQGLMLFGQDQYEEAIEIFSRIIEKDKEKEKKKIASISANFDTLSIFDMAPPGGNKWGDTPLDVSGIIFNFDTVVTLEESITSAAVNNYAICALYLRRIKVSIDKLEGLIKDNPLLHLSDSIVFNLCTLYDLSCSPDISILRKTVLQKLSIKYHVDDPMLHWRSFRLN